MSKSHDVWNQRTADVRRVSPILKFSSLIILENGTFLCLNNQAKRAISNCMLKFLNQNHT